MLLFQGMLDLMDPSRNMSKYRNLLSSQFVQPPVVSYHKGFINNSLIAVATSC